jgi:hypothetical protein
VSWHRDDCGGIGSFQGATEGCTLGRYNGLIFALIYKATKVEFSLNMLTKLQSFFDDESTLVFITCGGTFKLAAPLTMFVASHDALLIMSYMNDCL